MKISDETMKETKALPAAGASAVTDSVDLKTALVGPIGSELEVHVSVDALAVLVENETVTLTFEDSADNSTFTTIESAPSYVVTGGSGDGADAATWRFYLPPTTRRYFRASAAVSASGGDNTGDNFTLEFRV